MENIDDFFKKYKIRVYKLDENLYYLNTENKSKSYLQTKNVLFIYHNPAYEYKNVQIRRQN